jgi:diguanylate cyclase (GGDEF)-like protein
VERIRLTSPGLLLILAVVAAGGIFLLDMFYLQPNAESQEQASLRDQLNRTEQTARLLLDSEQNSLLQISNSLCDDDDLRRFAKEPTAAAVLADLKARLQSSQVDMMVVRDGAGAILAAWTAQESGPAAVPAQELPALQETLNTVSSSKSPADSGQLKLAGGMMLFARKTIRLSDADSSAPAQWWLMRRIGERIQARIGAAIGGQFLMVAGGQLPPSETNLDDLRSVWTSSQTLSYAWLVDDTTGRRVGFCRADLPLAQVKVQAAAGRRTVLIVLSLSVGLSLLVIVGAHILVTGPVVRLLRRLQRLETGQGSAKELARDLHGEPLLLARRLESAFDRLAYMSKTDQLTGLANRRHFEQVLDAFYNQARRYNRPLSLIVMDIDFFKAINDTGGHQAGDQVLKQVSDAIEKACRKADLPARFGGDEFAILLPETVAADAQEVGARVASAVAALNLSVRSTGMKVTISAGVADLNAGEINGPGAMLALADRALYAAKEMGRNRIIQAHDLTGLNWRNCGDAGDKVEKMCKKLAGLDNQFKDLFLRAIEEMVTILEHRSPHMADHAYKVQHYALLIGRELELSARVLKRIQIAAMLHDIGMIAMPDTVLLNSGQLGEEQVKAVRRHPLLSVRIMEGMEFLEQEIPAVRYHHERFDGLGYPEGIAGTAIPLTARILSVADSFDAMTSSRCHRGAKSLAQGLEEIRAGAGTQFDPAVVDAFVSMATRLGDKLMEIPPRRKSAPGEVQVTSSLKEAVESAIAGEE